jgi:hypothetical protein
VDQVRALESDIRAREAMFREMANMPAPDPRSFSQIMTERESEFGHTPFCGAHPQYILNETNQPVYVNGAHAARWRAMNPERMVLGLTRWDHGWSVQTRLDQYAGDFYTQMSAMGYEVHRSVHVSPTAADAMERHKEAVKLMISLASFHGRESSPVEDHQLVIA